MVAGGKVRALAESAGGIKIIWSRKLNSTAGRANWKRETLVSRGAEGSSSKTYRHHASIELAEKVIDDEGKFGIHPLLPMGQLLMISQSVSSTSLRMNIVISRTL